MTFQNYDAFDGAAKLDVTPRAVAEYLLITGDFAGFDSSMKDLLTAGVVSCHSLCSIVHEGLKCGFCVGSQEYSNTVQMQWTGLLIQFFQAEHLSKNKIFGQKVTGFFLTTKSENHTHVLRMHWVICFENAWAKITCLAGLSSPWSIVIKFETRLETKAAALCRCVWTNSAVPL